MNFIELTSSRGSFLLDLDSQWEIHDRGDKQAAQWVNNKQGRNLDALETYGAIRDRLVLTNPMIERSAQGEPRE